MPEPHPSYRWQLQSSKPESVLETIGSGSGIDHESKRSSRIEFYDSYDQSLRQAGLSLARQNGQLQLASRDRPCQAAPAPRKPAKIFWQDIPSPPLQAALKKRLKLRAATLVATLHSERQTYAARNADGKIIARLAVETFTSSENQERLSFLSLSPLIGYEEEGLLLASVLDSANELSREAPPLVEWAMAAAGYSEPPPSASQAIQLSPEQSAQSAVSEIARFMIQTARRAEPGIIGDIDTEHLHDYRVSIRKIRSVLSLIKGVYPKEDTKRLKTTFSALARATNRLRDLDVYLMEENSIRSQLPPYLQPGLERMFSDFSDERAQELQRIRKHLRSRKYAATLEELEAFLHGDPQPEGKRSAQPISRVAAKEILFHYQLVSKTGAAIDDNTPDAAVHELRIECKKLRYLLELFTSLFPAKEIKTIIKQLKGLQNTLGEFNDYCVQQESISRYLESTPRLDRKTSAALGGLIAHLHNSQREVRTHVSERFIQFNNRKMKRRFHRIFDPDRKADS